MKKLGLFYFSGTGNTRLVSTHIEEEFIKKGWEVFSYNIEDICKKEDVPDMEIFDLIGMGAQVIGYTTPRRMNQFLLMLPTSADNKPTFVFRTCGGVAETNYTASHSMNRMLKKKNYIVFHERLFSIGSNWIFKFDDTIMQQLYEATKRKIQIMSEELIEGKTRFYKTTKGLQFKKKVISGQSKLCLRWIGKNMKVSDDCNKCERCIKKCPSNNIKMVDGKFKFGMDCSACLRCIYQCPCQAISFRFFKFIPLKNGYDVEKSLSTKSEGMEEGNGKVPAFFQRYIQDDSM